MRYLSIFLALFLTPAFAQDRVFTCDEWQDPAFWQAANGSEVIRQCAAKTGFVEQRDAFGWTPLHYAAEYALASNIVQVLANSGADFFAATNDGLLPLDLAQDGIGSDRMVTIIQILERRQPHPEPVTYSTDFYAHLDQKDAELRFTRLIALDADVNVRNEAGDTILITTMRRARPKPALAEILIGGGADVNAGGATGWTALHWAVRTNEDPEIIRQLLDAGANLEAKTDSGKTPLNIAARYTDSIEILAELINRGADIDPFKENGWTPLLVVARYRQKPEFAQLLLDAGANVNAASVEGATALTLAAQESASIGFFEILLNAGANANHKKKNGWSVLNTALEKGAEPDVIQALLDAGADVNLGTDNNRTPLYIAVQFDQSTEILQLLLRNGADVTLSNNSGYTPLLMAVQDEKDFEVIETLVETGADINITTKLGWSALHLAINRDAPALYIQALLDLGADVDQLNVNGNRPVQSLLKRPILNWKALELLVDAGADLNFRTGETGAPVLLASLQHNRRIRLFEILLSGNIDPNLVDRSGDTVLARIALTGLGADLIPMLVAGGANPNQQKPAFLGNEFFRGLSPLHLAMIFNDTQLSNGLRSDQSLIFSLLANGADPNQPIRNRTTPMHFMAQYAQDPSLVMMLAEAGGDVNATTPDGITPLHLAALHNGNPLVIQAFVSLGANLEAQGASIGVTPLQLAVIRGTEETVRGFIDAGANLDVLGRNGETLLDFATGNTELNGSDVLLLLDGQPL